MMNPVSLSFLAFMTAVCGLEVALLATTAGTLSSMAVVARRRMARAR